MASESKPRLWVVMKGSKNRRSQAEEPSAWTSARRAQKRGCRKRDGCQSSLVSTCEIAARHRSRLSATAFFQQTRVDGVSGNQDFMCCTWSRRVTAAFQVPFNRWRAVMVGSGMLCNEIIFKARGISCASWRSLLVWIGCLRRNACQFSAIEWIDHVAVR